VNSGGTVGAVFCPVGFGDEHAAADRTAFQILIPENLCFQRSSKGQDRPPRISIRSEISLENSLFPRSRNCGKMEETEQEIGIENENSSGCVSG